MKPILFPKTATTFETQGLGVLADATSCKVTEERNGTYELEMQYPITGQHYADIGDDCILYAIPSPYRGPQPFRIYRTSKPINGIVTINARHIRYDLAFVPLNPFTASNAPAAMAGLQSNAAIPSNFTFWTNKTTVADFAVSVPSATSSILGGQTGSILDVYGGEYEFDTFAVKLYDQRGQDNGVSIRYGKNLTDLEQERNIYNVTTGIYPYWASADGATLVTCNPKIVYAAGTYERQKIIPVDFSQDFQDAPTPEQLLERAQAYVQNNSIGVPTVSLTVSFVQLEQTEQYKDLVLLEKCDLCDTVSVEYEKLGVSAKAKIVKIVTDVLLERYESVEIGEVRTNIADTIANQQQQIQQRPTSGTVQQIANSIAAAIMGAKGGSVRLLDTNGDGEPDTLYIADNPDPSKAVKVWRFNYAGWGASQNGYDGPFEMGAALGVGLYADFITAGTLNAALANVINLNASNLITGTIKSTNGAMTIDLDNAAMVAGNSASVKIGSASSYTQFLWQGFQSFVSGVLRSGVENNWTWANRSMTAFFSTSGLTCVGYKNAAGQLVPGYVSDPYSDLKSGYVNYLSGNTYCTGTSKAYIQRCGYQLFLENSVGGQNDAQIQAHDAYLQTYGLSLKVNGNIECTGSKNRVVNTESYGPRALNAMESPGPVFCDSGSGVLNENGECLLFIHPILEECIDPEAIPQWIVTGSAPGFWVEKDNRGATVHGPAGASFDWLLIAKQRGYAGVYAEARPQQKTSIDGASQTALDTVAEQMASQAKEYNSMLDAIVEQQSRLYKMMEA